MYTPSIYPFQIPLTEDLNRVTVPIIPIGPGWNGENSSETAVANYSFTPKTHELLTRMNKDGVLSCRDCYTESVLVKNGFSALMTGCPAWYDLPNVERTTFRSNLNLPYKKIAISDPGNPQNVKQAYKLVKLISERYPDADINFVFHRGITADAFTDSYFAKHYTWLLNALKSDNINVTDISYSHEGFSIYDDCDLHIGFRVHAHIYNLSKRNISLLIEEDGRGAGVNETLKLPRITAYDMGLSSFMSKRGFVPKLMKYLKRTRHMLYKTNSHMLEEVRIALDDAENNEYKNMLAAYKKMQQTYHVMEEYLQGIIH